MRISHIDNISYAKELYYSNKKVNKVGEHIIEKNVLDTIVGLICLGRIPEYVVETELNIKDNTLKIVVDNMQDFCTKCDIKNLASYDIIKNCNYDFGDKSITIDNIDLISIFRILSFGTMYNNVEEIDNGIILKY